MTVSVLEAQVQHYEEVRRRLFFGSTPPEVQRVRHIAVRPQPHRPDLPSKPAPKLPVVVRHRDFILVNSDGFTCRATIDLIIRQVCDKHGVAKKDIIGPSRVPQVVRARYEAMYRIRHELALSLARVGRALGGRDHTTVLHGVREHARRNGVAP